MDPANASSVFHLLLAEGPSGRFLLCFSCIPTSFMSESAVKSCNLKS